MAGEAEKPGEQVRWYVPEHHLLDMLVKAREAEEWRHAMSGCGVEITGNVFYDPATLILDTLGVPPESDSYCREHFTGLIYEFKGNTIDDMRELFAQILRDAHMTAE
jgi:hypothetical protein